MDGQRSQPDRSARAARPVRRAVFASDIHMHGGDPAGVRRAADFVRDARAQGADAVFLLGDVFLAWAGPRSLRDPGLAPFLDELADATADGVRVVMLQGNHDFMLGPHVERALGVEMPGLALDVALGGQVARLVHGDVFCTRDVSYHRLHRVIRAAPFKAVVNALPDRAVASVRDALLHSTRSPDRPKDDAVMDIVDEAVERALDSGPDLIVCGHVHRPRDARFERNGRTGRLVVMADFERTGSHAVWADGRLELRVRDARHAPPPGPVVAIDGPAGTGKSAVSRALARRLGWAYLDSGALYRAVTRRALYGAPAAGGALAALVDEMCLDVDATGRVVAHGRPVDDAALRTPEVSARVSAVSADPGLRAALLEVQRAAARRGAGLVAEGRDMSTVVFPDALVRFYLDARPEVRAARRARQDGPAGGMGGAARAEGDVRAVAAALAERDRLDSSRAHAPLRLGEGVEVLDTSDLTEAEVVDRLAERVARALADAPRKP